MLKSHSQKITKSLLKDITSKEKEGRIVAKKPSNLPPEPSAKLKLLSIDSIDDPERPVRKDLSPESVADLVASIKQVGIIEPLVVKPKGKRWEVIAGHRRLVASGIAKLARVPCYIVKASKEQTELLKLHENLYRADVDPSDEAEHFKYMIEEHKQSPTAIAKLIGRSESYVSSRLAIFNYRPELRHALDNGHIKFSVAREFNRMKDPKKMREYLKYATLNGITPKLARKWVVDHNRLIGGGETPSPLRGDESSQSEQIEHTSTCVYCQQSIKLAEANVVYIHNHCLKKADKPVASKPEDAEPNLTAVSAVESN